MASFRWVLRVKAVLLRYIDNQEEHHKTRSFQDEYRALLKEYGVEFDEEYVWG